MEIGERTFFHGYEVVKETDKALLLPLTHLDYWVPISICEIEYVEPWLTRDQPRPGIATITVPDWFIRKKEKKNAIFSDDKKHRLVLYREWNAKQKTAMVIGLNPSTANESVDDHTIRLLHKVLQNMGYGGLIMVNLFSIISSDRDIVFTDEAKANQERDLGIIFGYALGVQDIIFGWGTFEGTEERAKKVIEMFPDGKCFGVNRDGTPWHPRYLGYAYKHSKNSRVELFKFQGHKYEQNKYDRKARKEKIQKEEAKEAGQTTLNF